MKHEPFIPFLSPAQYSLTVQNSGRKHHSSHLLSSFIIVFKVILELIKLQKCCFILYCGEILLSYDISFNTLGIVRSRKFISHEFFYADIACQQSEVGFPVTIHTLFLYIDMCLLIYSKYQNKMITILVQLLITYLKTGLDLIIYF